VSDYRKLAVWEKSHEMALAAARIATHIRSWDFRTLRNQLIRSSMFVPANIVEGSGQESRKDFGRFLRYALNSAIESEYHCLVARDLGLMGDKDYELLTKSLSEIQRMLRGLIKRVRTGREPPDRAT
jgi:four helix bundle protein